MHSRYTGETPAKRTAWLTGLLLVTGPKHVVDPSTPGQPLADSTFQPTVSSSRQPWGLPGVRRVPQQRRPPRGHAQEYSVAFRSSSSLLDTNCMLTELFSQSLGLKLNVVIRADLPLPRSPDRTTRSRGPRRVAARLPYCQLLCMRICHRNMATGVNHMPLGTHSLPWTLP